MGPGGCQRQQAGPSETGQLVTRFSRREFTQPVRMKARQAGSGAALPAGGVFATQQEGARLRGVGGGLYVYVHILYVLYV